MSHQVLCEPSIVSSTKYCLCQCQVWSNKVSSINQVLCAHQARSLPLPHHIIILSSIRYYLPAVWSGCQECDCYKYTCWGPQHTCSWNFQARRGTCQKLQLRSWSAIREHLKLNWSRRLELTQFNCLPDSTQHLDSFCGVCVSNSKYMQSVKIRREGGLNRC